MHVHLTHNQNGLITFIQFCIFTEPIQFNDIITQYGDCTLHTPTFPKGRRIAFHHPAHFDFPPEWISETTRILFIALHYQLLAHNLTSNLPRLLFPSPPPENPNGLNIQA